MATCLELNLNRTHYIRVVVSIKETKINKILAIFYYSKMVFKKIFDKLSLQFLKI
jgi:hypothetical protein